MLVKKEYTRNVLILLYNRRNRKTNLNHIGPVHY